MDIDLKLLKSPYLIHSDIFRTAGIVRGLLPKRATSNQILHTHLTLLKDSLGVENIAFPTFNYDFPKTKIFDLDKTPSQVGVLTNFALKDSDFSRTRTPIFSFAIAGGFNRLYSNEPFGQQSLFSEIYQNDGTIIFYGTQIESTTYLHYVESQVGPPRYRYDKEFSGTLIEDDKSTSCQVRIHVRPLGLELDYDWPLLLNLLKTNGVIYQIESTVFAVKAKDLTQVWGDQISRDDMSILSERCRGVMFSALNRLGRRFTIADYERNA